MTGRQKSAEGIVVTAVAKARTVRQGTDKGRGKYAAYLVARQAAENPKLVLAFMEESRDEVPMATRGGTEWAKAVPQADSPAQEQLREEVCERDNLRQAMKPVKASRGSAGVDGMQVGELPKYLEQHWPAIREQLLGGTYKPQPVLRVEIPKPDGGVRKLGIPTVLDRWIQQAVMQVLQSRWDRTFSEHSHGFRPGRSAHQAVPESAAVYR